MENAVNARLDAMEKTVGKHDNKIEDLNNRVTIIETDKKTCNVIFTEIRTSINEIKEVIKYAQREGWKTIIGFTVLLIAQVIIAKYIK